MCRGTRGTGRQHTVFSCSHREHTGRYTDTERTSGQVLAGRYTDTERTSGQDSNKWACQNLDICMPSEDVQSGQGQGLHVPVAESLATLFVLPTLEPADHVVIAYINIVGGLQISYFVLCCLGAQDEAGQGHGQKETRPHLGAPVTHAMQACGVSSFFQRHPNGFHLEREPQDY